MKDARKDGMDKKGIAIETLIRVVIMVILILIVFKFGGKIASIFGGSNAPAQFDDFVSEINGMGAGSQKVTFLQLDKGMAAFGFTTTGEDFRCLGCYQYETRTSTDYISVYKTYTRKKPNVPECRDKACACLCTKGFSESPKSESETELLCSNIICRTIEGNFSSRVSLEEPLKAKNIQLSSYPSWELGFIFARFDNNKPLVGTSLGTDARKSTVCIKKDVVADKVIVTVLPGDCTSQK